MRDIVWLNDDSRTFLKRGYLREGVTPEERIEKIGQTAEKYLKLDGFAEKFIDYLSRGWYSLASPVWSNFGEPTGLPISCNGSFVPDSIDGILSTVAEVGMMTKHGAGTSAYFGDIRPRGSAISGGGETFGAVHFMQMFDKTTQVISQSNVRRGSFAAYYPVEGKDIEEFLEIREDGNAIQDMSMGVTITDQWMEEMKSGDKLKRKIWARIIKKRFESGYPYIFWTDTVNKNAPLVYRDKGMKIHASNLCVTGDTLLLTSKGEFPIQDLVDTDVEVWNGEEWSKVTVRKTGENQSKLREIAIDLFDKNNNFIKSNRIDCTHYHKFYIQVDDFEKEIEAQYLLPGDILTPYALPNGQRITAVIKGNNSIPIGADTFCVNEPKRHKAVFNSVLTGNCSEIALSSNESNSFVCDLSSMNLLYWDDWKDTDAVEVLTYFLDAVLTEYIEKTKNIPFMNKAHNFSKEQRALGVGGLGWHSYLQSKMIPFESMQAKFLNGQIWKFIDEKSLKASREMAILYGEPSLLKDYGIRNVTRVAIAPTTSSSFILGQVSPSVEPLNSNFFVKDLAKGKFTYKNPYLKETLKKYKRDNKETWNSIRDHGGSVYHLDFLSENEKLVFKTFGEISQKEIIIQAAQRQKYIDQSQSINLMIHPNVHPKEVNELLLFAWESGIKTLYYQRGTNPSQELARSIVNSCVSCES